MKRLWPVAANPLISTALRAIGLIMKGAVALAALGFALGMNSNAVAQDPMTILGQNPYTTRTTGLGTNSKSASGAGAPEKVDEESRTDETDDRLYRGKTDEMENNMIRDDGMLHFKTRPKEKDQRVDSLKNLQSSGTDPKFQGNFAISGVSTIDQIAGKRTDERQTRTENAADQNEQQVDSRFVRKNLTFKPQTDDKPKKAEAESSPSPTPSPTASPAAKNSSDSKE